jgi:hypothetical protein
MRRLAVGLLGVTLLIASTVGGAAAAGPDRSPFVNGDIDFAAGQACAFPVRWDGGISHATTLVFPATSEGDQLVRSVGYIQTVVTNLSTGKSIDASGGVRLDLVFHADGSVTANIDGVVLAAYSPSDLIGPSMWLYRGHLHDELDGSFTQLTHEFHGRQLNLCSALS